MSDNLNVTPGTGATVAADEVTDATLGTVKVQYVKIMDATLDGTSKAAVGANGLAVDVKASALPTGAATSAKQDTGNTSLASIDGKITACNTGNVTIGAAIPAGSNVIGALVANQSVNLAQIAGTTTATGNGTASAGCQRVTIASDNTAIPTTQAPATSGGLSIYRSLSVVATGQAVKTSAGQLYGFYVFNSATSVRYLKIYNKASAATVGTDTPVMTIPLPAGAGATVEYSNGLAFSLGISIGATTALADNSTTAPAANEVIVNLFYK